MDRKDTWRWTGLEDSSFKIGVDCSNEECINTRYGERIPYQVRPLLMGMDCDNLIQVSFNMKPTINGWSKNENIRNIRRHFHLINSTNLVLREQVLNWIFSRLSLTVKTESEEESKTLRIQIGCQNRILPLLPTRQRLMCCRFWKWGYSTF